MIERCILKGVISSVVQTRTIFTCDVDPVGGDTNLVLWGGYMSSMEDAIPPLISTIWSSYEKELQSLVNGHWIPYDVAAYIMTGENNSQAVANAVALVFIGVAAGLRHVGRKFLSPLGQSLAVGNITSGSFIAEIGNFLAAYITPFTGIGGGTITPGVSDKDGVFHPFVGGVVSSILGSIRRRKPGRGI